MSTATTHLVNARMLESDRVQHSNFPRSVLANGSVALDQWRGLALLLVLISHGFFFTNRVNGAGRIGVNLFFFISGILSYASLAKASQGSGWKLVRAFWWRRLRRLYPALLIYLMLMGLITLVDGNRNNLPVHSDSLSYLRALPFALTYTINYIRVHPRSLGHLWSLACELQFYVFAPVLYLFGRGTIRKQLLVFGFTAIAFSTLGFIAPLRMQNYESIRYHFEVAAWPMFVGFFCESIKPWFRSMPKRFVKISIHISIGGLVLVILLMPLGILSKNLVVAAGGVMLFPCLLAYVFGSSFPGRVGKWLAWAGERTYSIYLWQQPFTLCDYLPTVAQPVGAMLSVVVGALSFNLTERPFLSPNRTRQVTQSKL